MKGVRGILYGLCHLKKGLGIGKPEEHLVSVSRVVQLTDNKRIIKELKDNYIWAPLSVLKYTSLTVFLVYIAVPVFVRVNPWIIPKIVFLNILRPPFLNMSHPVDFGLMNTRHLYLNVEKGVDIGAWHVLPNYLDSDKNAIPLEKYEDELQDGNKVMLYLHGNSGSRATHHRVQLYKLLSNLGYHVFVIDYRGFGDSSGSPTENGVVADSYFTYKWLKKRTGKSQIFVWGHSLGSGITSKLVKILCEEGDEPAGIILESAFNNVRDAATNHPLSAPFRILPYFGYLFIDRLAWCDIYFNSDESIASITPNLLLLHAKDDGVVPFELGEQLYMRAKETRNHRTGDVEFVTFDGHHGYGHKHIYMAPELPQLVSDFVSKCQSSRSQTGKRVMKNAFHYLR